jgi:hypothetical protein
MDLPIVATVEVSCFLYIAIICKAVVDRSPKVVQY